jgi:hypothetical protein
MALKTTPTLVDETGRGAPETEARRESGNLDGLLAAIPRQFATIIEL